MWSETGSPRLLLYGEPYAHYSLQYRDTLSAPGWYATGITNLHNLDLCRNLQWLDLADNRVSDITPLATLTNLTYLSLDSNEITDIAPLAGLFNLDQLILTNSYDTDHPGNQIWNLEPLVTNAENGGLGSGDSVTLDSRTLTDPDTDEIPQVIAAQLDLLVQHGVDVILTEELN